MATLKKLNIAYQFAYQFAYHKYDMKCTLKSWSTSGIRRIYVNDEAGQSLGYWEDRFESRPRNLSNAYDRHRAVKGDSDGGEFGDLAWNGPAGLDLQITAAAGISDWYELGNEAEPLYNQLARLCCNSIPYELACIAKSKWTRADKANLKAIQSLTIEVAA